MLPPRRQQYLVLGRNVHHGCDPLLQRIDRVEADGISVKAPARMSYSYLQRHSGPTPAAQLAAWSARGGGRQLECRKRTALGTVPLALGRVGCRDWWHGPTEAAMYSTEDALRWASRCIL
jgi:hypothetical protein